MSARNVFFRSLHFEAGQPVAVSVAERYEKYNDEILLTYVQSGNQAEAHEAFNAIYNRYRMDIHRYLVHSLQSADDAMDVFSDTWQHVATHIHSFEWRGTPLKNWLLAIAHRKFHQAYRQRNKHTAVALDDAPDQALKFIEGAFSSNQTQDELSTNARDEADTFVAEMLDGLGEREKQIIMMAYFRNMNSTQISKALGMKPSAVRIAKMRILKKLTKRYEHKYQA